MRTLLEQYLWARANKDSKSITPKQAGVEKVRVRLLPSPEQEDRLGELFDSCKFVYNLFLEEKLQAHKAGSNIPTYLEQCKSLAKLKNSTCLWLNNIDSKALQFVIRTLDMDFHRFVTGKAAIAPKAYGPIENTSFHTRPIKIKDGKLFLNKFRDGILVDYPELLEDGVILAITLSKSRHNMYYANCTISNEN